MSIKRVKIVGLGGIGCYLAEPLCRYLNTQSGHIEVTFIDGDSYEEKNRARQRFQELSNKAEATLAMLKPMFPKVYFKSKAAYVIEDNVSSLIREGDVIFLGVDNHATRKLISDRCQELDNVVLISGGNDYTDGNVIYYYRKDGKDVTKSPTELYPEIAKPTDKNPGDATKSAGCQELISEIPQLIFTNNIIAAVMLNVFYSHEQGNANFEQVYVDMRSHRMRPTPDKTISFNSGE